jgi:hypothetical protein
MINYIKALIQLHKIVKFTKQGDLIISFNKSSIRFSKEGDLIINAGRHSIHNRDLFFDGSSKEFIDGAIKANSKSKKDLEKYVMGQTRTSEFTCPSNVETQSKVNTK